MSEQKKINIRNKRATFDYEILEEYVAGVVLEENDARREMDKAMKNYR